MIKQCDLKNVYLRDSPIDKLQPKPSANDFKINTDKQQETVNNYQRYILGYTGNLLYSLIIILYNYNIYQLLKFVPRIYTRNAFSVRQNFLYSCARM